jgi:cell wall-associated NlpC family hydrolase
MKLSALLPILLLAALALGGCSSAPPASEVSPTTASRAADVAASMVGKPYQFGGASPARGFDCSGLVKYSYERAGLRLNHGTDYLRKYSFPISRRSLQRGDLLFFDELGKKASHVGIYLGDRRFVHAPSSGKHVNVATLDNPYWQRSLNEARRLALD